MKISDSSTAKNDYLALPTLISLKKKTTHIEMLTWIPLQQVRLIKNTGPNINRVAPVTQIHVNSCRSFGTRFTNRLIHHRSRSRTYLGRHSSRTQNGRTAPIQLNRTRGDELRGSKRDRVGALKPDQGVGEFGGEFS